MESNHGALRTLTLRKSRSPRSKPWAAALTVLVFALASCGGDGAATTTAAAADVTAPAEGDGPIPLTVWFARDYIPEDQFQSLEQEHNLDITFDVRPGDNMRPTMLQMREAGEKLPDLIEDDNYAIPAYIQNDLLLPLTDLIAQFEEEDPELYAQLLPAVWEHGTFDGEIYQMANIANFDLIYYNVPWFEEAGVELPFENWEDILEAARLLDATRPEGHPWLTTNDSFDPLYHHMVNWGVPLEGAVPDLTSEQGIALIDWYQTMREEELITPDALAWGQDESRGVFVAGEGGMIEAGLNAAVDFIETPGFDFGEDWAATPIPAQPGGGLMAVPRGWSIVSETEHPYEASLVLRYLAAPEQAQSRLFAGSQTPLNTVVMDSPEVAEYFPHMTEDIKEKFVGETVALPAAANIGEVGPILIELRLELIEGTDASPEEVAEKYQAMLEEASS